MNKLYLIRVIVGNTIIEEKIEAEFYSSCNGGRAYVFYTNASGTTKEIATYPVRFTLIKIIL